MGKENKGHYQHRPPFNYLFPLRGCGEVAAAAGHVDEGEEERRKTIGREDAYRFITVCVSAANRSAIFGAAMLIL